MSPRDACTLHWSMAYVFDLEILQQRLQGMPEAYAGAPPFPHVVLDSFLRPEVAHELARCFPGP